MFEGIKALFSGQKTDSYSEHMAPAARRARSRQVDTRPGYQPRLSHPELAELYRNRLVRRIVDTPANAAAMVPQFSGTNQEFWTDLFTKRQLSIMPAQARGLAWASLYGFGACLIDVNDRLPLDMPMMPKRASEILSITPLSRRVIWPVDYMAGPRSEYFQVWSPQHQIGRVHRSRLLIYDGEDIDEIERMSNQGCGDSSVEQMNASLGRLFGGHESLAFAIQTFATFVYRVDDLDNMLANDGPKIERKLNALDEFRHLTRMFTADKKDEIEYKTMNMTGLPDAIAVLKEMVAVETGLPQIIVWGTSPTGSGLTNGGLSETAQYQSFITQKRDLRLNGNTEYLLEVAEQVYRKPAPGYKMPPALPPDQEKEQKMREGQARIDGAYMTMGVYGLKTIRGRFEGDYSYETKIHPDDLEPPEDKAPTKEPQFPEDDDDELEGQPPEDKDPDQSDEEDKPVDEAEEDPEKPLPPNPRKQRS